MDNDALDGTKRYWPEPPTYVPVLPLPVRSVYVPPLALTSQNATGWAASTFWSKSVIGGAGSGAGVSVGLGVGATGFGFGGGIKSGAWNAKLHTWNVAT